MRLIGVDSNILAYAAGIERTHADAAKCVIAQDLLERLGERHVLVAPVQTLGETFNVMLRRASRVRLRVIWS